MANVQPPGHVLKRIFSDGLFVSVDKDTRPNTAVFLGWSATEKHVFNKGLFIKQTPIMDFRNGPSRPVYYGDIPGPITIGTTWALGVWRVNHVLPNKRAWLEPTWGYTEKQLEELLFTAGFPEVAGDVIAEYPSIISEGEEQ